MDRGRQPALADPRAWTRESAAKWIARALRRFFCDPHEWQWIDPRFAPARAFRGSAVADGVDRSEPAGDQRRHLYNAKEPMSLFEPQVWLGHSSPGSTQHYARITPAKLAQAYTDASYFARNARTIEVRLDRDAITNLTGA